MFFPQDLRAFLNPLEIQVSTRRVAMLELDPISWPQSHGPGTGERPELGQETAWNQETDVTVPL